MTRTEEQHEALVELFVEDLLTRAAALKDPHAIVSLALHASAAITGELGPFERREVKAT